MHSRKSKAMFIVADMINTINNGEYEPGETVIEAQIAEKYGVSITPAREALNHLAAEGYIDKAPHRGYRIKSISYSEVRMLLEYRYVLENAVVSFAVLRANSNAIAVLIKETEDLLAKSDEEIFAVYRKYNYDFHVGVAEAIENKYLLRDYAKVMGLLWRAMAFGTEKPKVRNSMLRHIDLCHAILAKDAQAAHAVVERYLGDTESRVIGNIGGSYI